MKTKKEETIITSDKILADKIFKKYNIKLDYNNFANYYLKETNEKFGIPETLKPIQHYSRQEYYEKEYYKKDNKHFRVVIPLPEIDGYKDIELKYTTLFGKYSIHVWDENRELVAIEYIHEDSVKELIELVLRNKEDKK